MNKTEFAARIIDYRRITVPPRLCPACGLDHFIPHKDGWQCFHCMKIVYTKKSILALTSSHSR
jgi:ribosomal protein S27AE